MALARDKSTRDKLHRLPVRKLGFLDGRKRMPFLPALFLCVMGILLNCATVGPKTIRSIYQAHNDFRHFYTGAKLVGSGGLYDVDQVLATQRQVLGTAVPNLLPTRLPFYYAFISPIAGLPFPVAQWFWLAGMTLAIGFFIRLRAPADRTSSAIACCWSWPLLLSLPLGQDIALVMVSLGAALWAVYARRNWWLAGLLLSLCLIKFNLIVLFPLLVVGKRKWRLAAGFVSGTACLLAISFLVAGWGWPRQYASLIFDPRASPGLAAMPNLHGLRFSFQGSAALEYLLSLAVIGMVWWVVRHRPFGVAAAATLLGSLLVSQHAYLHDCAVLIPALLTLVRPPSGVLVRCCAWVLLLPVAYVVSFFAQSGTVPAVLLLVLLIGVTLDSPHRKFRVAGF